MKWIDLIRLSADNLTRRKGRTVLTVIGVVVGTCAIVVMISLGLAMSQSIEAMLQSWGDLTKINIYNYSYGVTDSPVLDDAMLAGIAQIPHVSSVSPLYQANSLDARIVAGRGDRYNAYCWETYGMFPEAMQPMGITLAGGDFPAADADYGKDKIPVLVGQSFAYSFFDSRRSPNSQKYQVYEGQTDAMGNPVPPFVDVNSDRIILRLHATDSNGKEQTRDYQLVVVGVMNPDYAAGYFTVSGLMLRLNDLKKIEEDYKILCGRKRGASSDDGRRDRGYEQVYVKVDKVDNVEEVEAVIKGYGYDTYSMVQTREEMQGQVAQTQMILGGLAAISLFVAALNIANTMTMAIYERTREIGVMKVLGCELGRIRAMFLMEAGGIGLLGGVAGVALSLIISFVMNHFGQIVALLGLGGGGLDISSMFGMYGDGSGAISVIPLWLVLFALGFATLVGLLSGLMPAIRATRISALEAIRHE